MGETLEPLVNALNAPFWEAAKRDELVLPHCVATGHAFWPPSPVSPYVTGGAVAWRGADPAGKALSVVVYRRPFLKAFGPLMPYGIALVALAAGPRLMAHVAAPEAQGSPRPGDRVRIRFAAVLPGGPPIPQAVRADKGDDA